jgi:hypothetical protein
MFYTVVLLSLFGSPTKDPKLSTLPEVFLPRVESNHREQWRVHLLTSRPSWRMKGEYAKKHFYSQSRAHDPINQDIYLSGGATTLLLKHRGTDLKKNCADNA